MRPPSQPARPRSDIAFPFHADRRGRTAHARPAEHVHDLVEQLLFTSPGERVMRPDFGCGLLDLVFAPAGPELVGTLELSVQAALQRWLGDLIEVVSLDIAGDGDTVRVQLSYLLRATGAVQEDFFEGRAA
ncbi:GPW/gp25 family protein [Streptomyces nogalater]|uniref:GPW/gp25 family protein n=1 Tax=Streptomyces nogalater TaxID=38314 RepID=A0ABW0WSJ3_STRNO